jgi:tetratricopeptide (TPR) repeat protein
MMSPRFARFAAILLLACAAGIGGLGVFRASLKVVWSNSSTIDRVGEIVNTLGIPLLLGGVAIVVYAVGETQARNEENARALQQSIGDLTEAIARLPGNLQMAAPPPDQTESQQTSSTPEKIQAPQAQAPGAQPPAPPAERMIPFVQTAAPALPGDASPQANGAMRETVALLKEIRELTLMNESQRQQRYAIILRQRREALLAETSRQIQHGQWPGALKALAALEADFHDDPAVAELRARVERGRAESEAREVSAIRGRIEDLMAIGNWDLAHALATKFNENFPHNAEGKQLLERVDRERQVYIESTANRLYTEIKTDIERRQWRRARVNAEKLLQMFPGHRRSATLRPQLQTIRDNAEIEERQEQEHRIQELVRGKRFAEAIELAQDVVDDFPGSPQAATLAAMLPKMRELAVQEEMESEGVG